MSLFSQPGMLPGPCCFPQSLFSSSSPQEGLSHLQGAWWHLSSLWAPGGTGPLRGLLSSTIRHSPGFLSWSLGNPGGAVLIPSLGVIPCAWGGPEHLQGTAGASGAGALCCTRLSISLLLLLLFHLPCLFLPQSSSLPVPAGTPSCVWHSPRQGFSPQLWGTPSPTRDPVAEGHNTPKPV